MAKKQRDPQSLSRKNTQTAADDVRATLSQAHASIDTSLTGKPMSNSPAETPVPKTFGRYKIEKELGKGAMGVVYLAEDTQLHRKVALKIPKKSALEDPESLERFYREARTTATIRHNNICPVYDVGAIDGVHYLTMAYIPGKPVSSFLGKGKLPAPKQVALLIRKIALALDEAHRTGVVHRDLKPSNVMLDDRGEPIVMDFGLACQVNTEKNARLTQSGAILGTPAYMAPEQVRGEIGRIGPASDIYALGVMLYQFLTGELPFSGPIMMVFAQIITEHPKPPGDVRPDVDPTLAAICQKMMAKEISQRYASMKEVANALTEYLKTGAVTGLEATSTVSPSATVQGEIDWGELPDFPEAVSEKRRATTRKKKPRPQSRRSIWSIAGAAALCVFLLCAVILIVRRDGTLVKIETDPQSKVKINGNQVEINSDGPNPVRVSVDGAVNSSPTVSAGPPAAVAPFNADQARAHQEAWAKHLGLPVEWENNLGMKFRLIPPGEFLMGATPQEIEAVVVEHNGFPQWQDFARSEGPQHKVRLTQPYYLAVTEVTQSQYETVAGRNPSRYSKDGEFPKYRNAVQGMETGRFPVDNVTWIEAADFCANLSRREALAPVYSRDNETVRVQPGNGYRLPTEAEWEFSCRAGTQFTYMSGDTPQSLTPFACFAATSGLRPHAVGEYEANPFGLNDMIGNALEWVEDVWNDHSYLARKDQLAVNPLVKSPDEDLHSNEIQHVLRGGHWFSMGTACRSSIHWPGVARHSYHHVNGFRVAVSVDAVKQSIAKTGWPLYKVLVDDKGVVTEGQFDDLSDTRPGWKTENGELRSVDNNDKMLNFGNKHYGDFQFTAEYKIIGKRGAVFIAHSEWRGDRPKGYSVGLGGVDGGAHAAGAIYRWEYKSGNIWPLHAGEPKASPKLDEWATLEVTMRGTKLTAKINGQVVSEGEDKNNEFPTGRLAFSLPYETVLCLRSVKVRGLPAELATPTVGFETVPSKTPTAAAVKSDAETAIFPIAVGKRLRTSEPFPGASPVAAPMKPYYANSAMTISGNSGWSVWVIGCELQPNQILQTKVRLQADDPRSALMIGLVEEREPQSRNDHIALYCSDGEFAIDPQHTWGTSKTPWRELSSRRRAAWQSGETWNDVQIAYLADRMQVAVNGQVVADLNRQDTPLKTRSVVFGTDTGNAQATAQLLEFSVFEIHPDEKLLQQSAATERALAEWVLKEGKNQLLPNHLIIVTAEGTKQDVKNLNELPKAEFVVSRVNLSYELNSIGGYDYRRTPIPQEGWDLLSQSHLSELILTGVPLSSQDIPWVARCQRLTQLFLGGCKVSNVDLNFLGTLQKLETLELFDTQVTDAGLASLATLQKISRLNLGRCGITDEGLKYLQPLRQLRSLDVSQTQVTNSGLATLATCSSLNFLTLDQLKVDDQGLKHLRPLQLAGVSISNVPITDQGLAHLSLSGMCDLRLNSTDITDQSVERFANPLLFHAKLGNTRVTDRALDLLEGCPQLLELDVRCEKVTADRVRQFAKAHPRCRVLFLDGVDEKCLQGEQIIPHYTPKIKLDKFLK